MANIEALKDTPTAKNLKEPDHAEQVKQVEQGNVSWKLNWYAFQKILSDVQERGGIDCIYTAFQVLQIIDQLNKISEITNENKEEVQLKIEDLLKIVEKAQGRGALKFKDVSLFLMIQQNFSKLFAA